MRLRKFPAISALKENLLIRRAKKGDSEAFGELYLSYIDQIYRYIYFKVGQDKKLAEDITQDTFVKALENIKTFKKKKGGTFKAWLYAIARNLTIDHFRTNGETMNLKIKVVDDKQDVEKKVVIKDEYENLISLIAELPELQREIITMAYINGLSNKEIVQVTGKTNEAVRAAKYRAVKNLKKLKKNEK